VRWQAKRDTALNAIPELKPKKDPKRCRASLATALQKSRSALPFLSNSRIPQGDRNTNVLDAIYLKIKLRRYREMLIVEATSHGLSNMQLIVDKLTAAKNESAVSRRRLIALLEESMATCSTTIVNGRAGSGKTSLISDFASRCGRATAWYKVDAPDGDPSVFFRYLIAAIRQHRPQFGGKELESLLTTTEESDFSMFAEAFVYELLKSQKESLLIVIEDLHLVYDAPWLVSFFSRVLPLLPADVHMVITSRTLPPAPLWRMRSKQNLTVIDEPELAFTRQEAIALFDLHGLSREQATIALDHTHGRAHALAACAESIQMEQDDQPTSRHVTAGN